MNAAIERTGLPLVPYLPQISSLLDSRRALVLTAEPGSGKSTLVPPFLLDAAWLEGKKIVMLEPRRLAAAAVAARIAELLGEPLGRRAGYRVRSASRVSAETRIEVVTEALLTRAIQTDPLLSGTGLVIFDEYHERSIHADLSLALALEVKRARPDLALLVMSATLDAEPLTALLDGAPALSCPGRLHPVAVSHAPPAGRGPWASEIAKITEHAFDDCGGDVLVFLPGVGEIHRVRGLLEASLGGRASVLPLHGSLPLEEQRRVIAPRMRGTDDPTEEGNARRRRIGAADVPKEDVSAGPRRIILSTSIAETSLTVPGVRVVVDAGLARISRFHPATGMDRLVTERVSAASAAQRAGRAGRVEAGACVRAWREGEPLLPALEPEILRSDLSGLVLECALWGARTAADLRWLDRPPQSSWAAAEETLRMLGLLGPDGPTAEGRAAAGLGLSPRLAVLARVGAEAGPGEAALAAACAALLGERDGSEAGDDPDIRLRLEILRTSRGGRDSWRAAMVREIDRILRRIGDSRVSRDRGEPRAGSPGTLHHSAGAGAPPSSGKTHAGALSPLGWSSKQEDEVGTLLARAFTDRIARREPDGTYRFVTGRSASFPTRGLPGTGRVQAASRAASDWIVAPDVDAGETAGVIRLAAPISEAVSERSLTALIEEKLQIRWQGITPRAAMVRKAGRLVLSERPAKPDPAQAAVSFQALLAAKGASILPWDDACRALLARMRFYAGRGDVAQQSERGGAARAGGRGDVAQQSDRGPAAGTPGAVLLEDLSDEGLVRTSVEWLHPFLGFSGGPVIDARGLHRALGAKLGSARRDFERSTPESIELPTGGRRRIDYTGAVPAVEARIQEVFGLAESPRVCGVPLTFRLLSPAHRPLQITSDLAGFWRSAYVEVRKEMRGRYPKHYWPEDPTKAEAISGVRPKRRLEQSR